MRTHHSLSAIVKGCLAFLMILAAIVLAAQWMSVADAERPPMLPTIVEVGDVDLSLTDADPSKLIEASIEAGDLWPSVVTIEKVADNSYHYLVNGVPEVFIGMGYNPIYRHLSDAERAANYDRDFRILCHAGVNTIIGWDFDKGYEQDRFDELTLDYAHLYGIGVVMPFYLPPDGDYEDPTFTQSLLDEAATKIIRFKDHPALRMWGVGNEVLTEMDSRRMRVAFGRFYLQLADLFHLLDPNHPVIYRDAEDQFIPGIRSVLEDADHERPWLLYGMNIYSLELTRIVEDWPTYGLDRPLFVTEFGAEPHWFNDRAFGYVSMWEAIRSRPEYVLGGAPYVWTIYGPEPTDLIWGLMDIDGQSIDDTFSRLADEWRWESMSQHSCQSCH